MAVDAGGTIYAVGRTHALYVRGSLRWYVYPYPTAMRPLGAATSPGGQLFIVGHDGLLVRFRDGAWDRPLVPGLSAEAIGAADVVYVLGGGRVVWAGEPDELRASRVLAQSYLGAQP